jgi:hypothetical protein
MTDNDSAIESAGSFYKKRILTRFCSHAFVPDVLSLEATINCSAAT